MLWRTLVAALVLFLSAGCAEEPGHGAGDFGFGNVTWRGAEAPGGDALAPSVSFDFLSMEAESVTSESPSWGEAEGDVAIESPALLMAAVQLEEPGDDEPIELEGPEGLDVSFTLEALKGQTEALKDDPTLLELVLDTYADYDMRPLFLNPHYDSASTTRFLKLLVQSYELGFSPEALGLTQILEHVEGSCRVTFPKREPGLAVLEERLTHWVTDPSPPLVTLRCGDDWRPHEKRILALDFALISAFYRMQRTLSPDAGIEELKARWQGPGQAVFQVVGRLPDNHRYFARVGALRKYLGYWGRGEFPVLGKGGRLKRGDVGPRVARLKRRLVIEGFLASVGDAHQEGIFDRVTRKAVRSYRQAYGLRTRSQVDDSMLEVLSWDADVYVSALWQSLHSTLVEGLERESTYVRVNIPAFSTEFVDRGRTQNSFKSIVGFPYAKKGGRTPAMASRIEYVDLNPEWTPTPYVLENELLPKAKKDNGFWQENRFVLRGKKRVQLPGPQNTLGQVVLGFSNDNNISLHGTNEGHRFEYSDRALSHGCVRVEGIEKLAGALLKSAGVSLDLRGILARVEEKRVVLENPIPIYLVYDRINVRPDGAIAITPDPYHLVRMDSLDGQLSTVRYLVGAARKTRRVASVR